MHGRPLIRDDRPPCQAPNCTAPRTLGSTYTRADGTVVRSYRKWCSWHANHPLSLPNPGLAPARSLDEPGCHVPGCTRVARRYPRTTTDAEVAATLEELAPLPALDRPPTAKERRAWARAELEDMYGPESTQHAGYALTCSRHTKAHIPSLTNPHVAALAAERPPRLVLPRPPRKVKKVAPAPAPAPRRRLVPESRRRLKAVPQKPAAAPSLAGRTPTVIPSVIAALEKLSPKELKKRGFVKSGGRFYEL